MVHEHDSVSHDDLAATRFLGIPLSSGKDTVQILERKRRGLFEQHMLAARHCFQRPLGRHAGGKWHIDAHDAVVFDQGVVRPVRLYRDGQAELIAEGFRLVQASASLLPQAHARGLRSG